METGVSSYYLNFKDSNYLLKKNRTHATIGEIEPLQTLIQQIVLNTVDNNDLPLYITTTKPTEPESRLRLAVKSPVSIDIYDSFGNHTGLASDNDPTSDIFFIDKQIPNSYYYDIDGHKYIGLDGRDDYQIELKGLDLGTFTFEIKEILNDNEISKESFINIPVSESTIGILTISNNKASDLELDIDGDNNTDIIITPGDEPNSVYSLKTLVNIIDSLDVNKHVKKVLKKKIHVAEKLVKKGNIKAAARVLQNVKQDIRRFSKERTPDKFRIEKEVAEKLIFIIDRILSGLV